MSCRRGLSILLFLLLPLFACLFTLFDCLFVCSCVKIVCSVFVTLLRVRHFLALGKRQKVTNERERETDRHTDRQIHREKASVIVLSTFVPSY